MVGVKTQVWKEKAMQGFELIREEEVAELNSTVKMFKHLKSGAEVVSVENDDENKVFAAVFRTLPQDSTGIAHILEHAVLGGSRKYPVKEPFLELLKGSLQTFVNAGTWADKTEYPVASTNLQDFYNLVDVYLDAVFFPNITRRTLAQEGWHYELEDLDEPLNFRGIVFNEMKGAYSSPDDRVDHFSRASIFPDNLYQYDAGGDPEVIPDLTYEQFTDFYRRYYHPSNSLLWFWGDDPTEMRLKKLAEYLDEFEPLDNPPDTNIQLQQPFDAPVYRREPYAVSADDGGEAKNIVTVNWLLEEPIDPVVSTSASILRHILIGTPASPLRKALIESGLGEDLAGNGMVTYLRQMMFSTGLRGVEDENVKRIEPLILDRLRDLVENGIERETVEAAVNTTEFRLREMNTGGYPRGIAWAHTVSINWAYGADYLRPLSFESTLAAVKLKLATNPRYFENLIQEWLLNNQHRSTVVLEPDPEMAKRVEERERRRLDAARASMTEDDLRAITEETRALREWQNTPDTQEALDTIPRLMIADLDKENTVIPVEEDALQDASILYHDLFTNGIVYLDLGFDLHSLPADLLPYTNLFGKALLEMGTAKEDFVKLSQRIGRLTGGIYPTTFISSIRNSTEETAWLILRAKATAERASDMLDILQDILLTAQLDNKDRFLQMVLEEKAAEEANLMPAGHMVSYHRLNSHFETAGWVDEQVNGLDYLFFLRELADTIQNDWGSVLEKLERIRALLVNRQSALCNVTLDDENYHAFEPQLSTFLATLPSQTPSLHDWQPSLHGGNEGLTVPAQVNYVAKGTDLFRYGFEMDGSVLVVSKYLRLTHLWEKIRVMGGAYGAFSLFDPNSGIFSFISYRDPNLLETVQAYDASVDFLQSLHLTDKELTSAIIGAISDLDAYQLPDAKGFTSMKRYLTRVTDEMRQKYRNEVLSTTNEDFREFADVLAKVRDYGDVVVLGSAEKIASANETKGNGWLVPTKVL